MTTWDFLAAHPDMTHVSFVDDPGVVELFARAQIDPAKLSHGTPNEQLMAAYDKHPTHWILFTIYSGYTDPKENGYAAIGLAKRHYTKEEAYRRFTDTYYHSGATLRGMEKLDCPDPLPPFNRDKLYDDIDKRR